MDLPQHLLLIFSLVACFLSFRMSVEAANCSPINKYEMLSKKEDICFQVPISSLSGEHEKLDVTFLGLESHYFVPQMYTFYTPNVSVICECTCDAQSGICSPNTNFKHDKCARHKGNSVCTHFYKEGADVNVCPLTFRTCCQVYFTIPDRKDSKFHCLYLNKHLNKMQLSLAMNISKDGQQRKSLVLRVPTHVRFIQFDNDSVISLSIVSPHEALPDNWYYVQDGSTTLKTAPYINKIGEQDFRKLGWFQMGRFGPDGKEELLAFDTQMLSQHLRIYPQKCLSKSAEVEWEFHAKYYTKDGGPTIPLEERLATQIHGRFVSDIVADVDKRSVVVDHRHPPELQILITKSEPLLGQCIFNASIQQDKDSGYILKITLITGQKITYLINVGNDQEGLEDYYATVYKSQNFPVPFTFRLTDKTLTFPTWVCLYEESEGQKQVCQSVDLSQEKYYEGEAPTDKAEAETANLQLREDDYDHGYLMSLVILTLCLAILSILLTSTILLVHCMRRRKKGTGGTLRSTNSFEKIKKDLRKDERVDSESNRYSHLYEYLRPTNTGKPATNANSTETHAV